MFEVDRVAGPLDGYYEVGGAENHFLHALQALHLEHLDVDQGEV